MEGLKKDTRKIKYFLMKTLETVHATTCRTFSIYAIHSKVQTNQSLNINKMFFTIVTVEK
jgi:hypothetical protein